jgi:plasmid maintenance system killer protein
MIKSFRCRDTQALADDEPVRRFKSIERAARRKLEMLAAAERLVELRSPPPAIASRRCEEIARDSTASASMTSVGFVFAGSRERKM